MARSSTGPIWVLRTAQLQGIAKRFVEVARVLMDHGASPSSSGGTHQREPLTSRRKRWKNRSCPLAY